MQFFNYFIALIVNLITYALSFMISTNPISLKNPNLYWCLLFTLLTFTCTYLLEAKKKYEDSLNTANDKLSTLLIKKDSIPNVFTFSILPDTKDDCLQKDLLTNIELISNSEIDQLEKPSFKIECNKPLIFNMPTCKINEINHVNTYIYYFQNINPKINYQSKKYWAYKFSFTPKSVGEYKITFTLETSEISTAKKFIFHCS